MNKHTKLYQDYVVFVESKSLRGRSKEEYLRQVRKLAEYYPSRSLKQLTERQVFDYLIFRRERPRCRRIPANFVVHCSGRLKVRLTLGHPYCDPAGRARQQCEAELHSARTATKSERPRCRRIPAWFVVHGPGRLKVRLTLVLTWSQ